MNARVLGAVFAAWLVVTGCGSQESSSTSPVRRSAEEVSAGGPMLFVNQVWVVAESPQLARGELRVFLSEGTLVMASAHGAPALGTWRYQDGRLTITEDGLQYRVDILELNERAFRIRIYSPGAPVDIRFERAGRLPAITDLPQQPEGRQS